MDPQATLNNIMNDLFEARNPSFSNHRQQEHKEAAAAAMKDLAYWLETGGFPPRVVLTGLSSGAIFAVPEKAEA